MRMGGSIRAELTSADPEAVLCAISESGIRIENIKKKTELTLILTLDRKDYPSAVHISEKCGSRLQLVRKSGLYWGVRSFLHRPVLLVGSILLAVCFLMLPVRIFFVQVEGNERIPDRQILSAAEESGICFGASRREVRSERMKNRLLSNMPELEWAGVNTQGCVAIISVRERNISSEPTREPEVSSIAAAKDGYIVSMTVTKGNSLCQPGQYVQEGQLLVSGYTDCGFYIQASPSEADILAQTKGSIRMISPVKWAVRQEAADRKRSYSLIIGKKRINLWKDSGILDSSCGRIYKEKYAALPGGFQLPVALCVEEIIFYETVLLDMPVEPIKASLSSFAQEYLVQQMIAGVIQDRDEQFTVDGGTVCLAGSYTCQEMIGRVKTEQMGEQHG